MLIIAVVGIKITARAQVGMAAVEYLILIGLAVAGLVFVLSHHPGTVPITKGWFSLSGVDGKGSAAGKKMGSPEFSSAAVQGAPDATLADFIENGGPQKKASHAFANKGVSAAEASKLAAYVKTLK